MPQQTYISPANFVLFKEEGVVPTVPDPPTLRKYHSDFLDTDLELGCWARNIKDGKLFYRSQGGIEEFDDDLFGPSSNSYHNHDDLYVKLGSGSDPVDLNDWFELVNPGDADEYLRCKKPLSGDYEIQAWSDEGQFPPTIWEAMPAATSVSLGGIIVGANLTIDEYGVLNASASGSGSADWGAIGGSIALQTDLVLALAAKAPLASPSFTGHININTPTKTSRVINIGTSTTYNGIFTDGNIEFTDNCGFMMASTDDTGGRLRVFHESAGGDAYIDYYTDLHYRSGASSSAIKFTMTSTGRLGLNEENPDEIMEINGNLHVTGNIYAEGDVSAFASGDPGSDFWDYMPPATNSTMGGFILWDDQFTMTAGVLKIKDNVLVPAAHTHDDRYFTESETTSAISGAIAALVGSVPSTLDTLQELGDALGDDPNFATTIATALGLKLAASAYTASDVLSKLLTVDGTGTGLDADLLDSHHGSYYATQGQSFYLGTTQIAINRGSGAISLTGITSIDGTAGSTPKFLSTNFTIEESAGVLIFKHGTTVIGSMNSSGYFKMKDEIESFATL